MGKPGNGSDSFTLVLRGNTLVSVITLAERPSCVNREESAFPALKMSPLRQAKTDLRHRLAIEHIVLAQYHLHYASYFDTLLSVPVSKLKHRSGCPVSISLEAFGDRWSLLIIRDLMVRGYRTFKEFQQSGERIATNILADRLKRLRAAGIIATEPDPADGRKLNYRLTEKGIDLAPVLLELLIWGARHEDTGAPCAVIEEMATNREAVLAEVRRRWRDRDSRPFLPRFGGKDNV